MNGARDGRRSKAFPSALTVAVIVAALPVFAAEQPTAVSPVKAGDRIRVWASTIPKGVGGEVIDAGPKFLKIRVADRPAPLDVPVPSITRMERSLGKRSNTGVGALVGVLIGLGMGGVLVATCYGEGCPGQANHQAAVVGVSGGLGGLLGAAIGSLTQSERWETLPAGRVGLSVVPQRGGVGLRLSMKF